MFFIYILYSTSADKYYVGYTEDVDRRVYLHNHPIRSCFTSKYRPWVLKKSFQIGEDRTLALKLERKIKRMKSRTFIERLLDNEKGDNLFQEMLIELEKAFH